MHGTLLDEDNEDDSEFTTKFVRKENLVRSKNSYKFREV